MDWLLKALNIRDGEARRVLSLAAYLLVAVSTFITGRIQRDSLFLSSFSKEDLAWMYISVAVLVPIPAVIFGRIQNRFRRDRLLVATLVVTIVLMGVMRLLLLTKQPWVTILLYNFVEAYGTFLILLFWTFAGDLFSSREAKRLFPIVSAGSVVAGIVCGFAVSGLVQQIGTENLLLCQMVLLSIGAVIINDVGTRERHRLKVVVARDKTASSSSSGFKVQSQARHIFASKHLKIIAGMTVATFVTVPLVDYQFKVLVKEHFTTNGVIDTDAMSSFMGLFSAATGVVAAVMQLGITGRLLERFGIVAALLLLPVSLLCGLFALLSTLVNAFVAVVFTKGAENSLRYSITDATMQVLYTPVPSATRGRAKTFIDGVIKPISGGVAGAAMVLLVGPLQLPITSLAVVAVVLLAGWLGLIMLIRSEYVRELLATLRKRRLDFSQDALVINDAATVAVLRHRLRGSDVVDVRNAIELCRRVQGHDLTAELLALLDRDDRGVRKAALELIARQGRPGSASVADLARLQALIASTTKTSALSSTTGLPIGDGIEGLDRDADITDDDVHAAAVSAYCAVVDVSAGSDAVLAIAPLMTDAVPVVRGAAVAGIIRHGGDAGLALASDPLEAMLADDDEAVRLACARVLEQIARPGLHGPAAMLMRDDNPRVRLGAIAAAGAMRAPELVAPLIEALSDVDTGRAAQVALAGYGDVVIPQLSRTLRSSDAGPRRRQVPRVLERIGTKAAFEALLQALVATPSSSRLTASKTASSKKVALVGDYVDREHDGAFGDVDTRRELARSCARLRDRLNLPVDEKPIRALIAVEIARHYQLLATTADLGALAADPKTSLLRDALDVRRERSLDAIFRLLAVIQPLKVIETVLGNLRSTSSTARANAIEVLDNLLDADDKRGLLPIVECAGELRDAAGELASRGPAILERAIERGERTGFAVLSTNALPEGWAGNHPRHSSRGRDLTTIEKQSATAWLSTFLRGDDAWLVVCALQLCAELGLHAEADVVTAHLQHASPIVRETALRALLVLVPPAVFADHARGVVDDSDAVVARSARRLLAAAA